MDEMESKLNSILSNPQMMEQIMSMAQSMGSAGPSNNATAMPEGFGDIDLGMLQKLSGFAQGSRIDPKEDTLLHALVPYLSPERISKLEKAMRAAKLARVASGLLSSGGFAL